MCSRPRINFSGWNSLSSAATPLAHVLGEIADPLQVGGDPHRADDFAQVNRHRLPPGDGQHRALLDQALQIVDFGVGGDDALAERDIAADQRVDGIDDHALGEAAHPRLPAGSAPAGRCRTPWRCVRNPSCSPLAEPAGNVVLGASIARRGEYLVGVVELDQLAEIHEGGLVGDARGLLHVVGDDGDGVVLPPVPGSVPRPWRSKSDRAPSTARRTGSLRAAPRRCGRCRGAAAGRRTGSGRRRSACP